MTGKPKLPSGIKCADAMVPPDVTPQTVQDNIEDLAKELGNQCVRESDFSSTDTMSSGAFETSMEASAMWGMASASASAGAAWMDSAAQVNDSFREQGCGNIVVDTKEILDATASMNCTLNREANESSTSVSAGANISIKVPPGAITALVDSLEEQKRMLYGFLGTTTDPFVKEMLREDLRGILSSARDISSGRGAGSIVIQDSTLRATASGKVKVVSNLSSQQKQMLQEDFKKIVRASANNNVQQKLGAKAMSTDVTALVDEKVTTLMNTDNREISDTLNKVTVKTDGSSGIVIEAPIAITLDNTVVDASVAVDVATTSLMSRAMEIGKTLSRDMLTEATSTNSVRGESAGLDEIYDSITERHVGGAQAVGDTLADMGVGESSWGKALVGVVGLIVVGGIVVLGINLVSKKAPPAHLPPMMGPPPPMMGGPPPPPPMMGGPPPPLMRGVAVASAIRRGIATASAKKRMLLPAAVVGSVVVAVFAFMVMSTGKEESWSATTDNKSLLLVDSQGDVYLHPMSTLKQDVIDQASESAQSHANKAMTHSNAAKFHADRVGSVEGRMRAYTNQKVADAVPKYNGVPNEHASYYIAKDWVEDQNYATTAQVDAAKTIADNNFVKKNTNFRLQNAKGPHCGGASGSTGAFLRQETNRCGYADRLYTGGNAATANTTATDFNWKIIQ